MDIKKIKVDTWDLPDLLSEIKSGRLRIPRFQRDFVWEKSKVIKLLSSIYKEFPIGSFFIWEAPKQYNSFFRKVPELEIKDPDSSDEIKYILDGQQRITSLYVTLKGLTINSVDYNTICFDLDGETFLSTNPDEERFLPLSKILGEERHIIYDKLNPERKASFNKCVQRFQNYPLSVVLVKDKNLEEVCDIFERINQGGKRLSIFDLFVAGTWSEDFELKEKIGLFNKILENSFGRIEEEVFTETLSLIVKGQCTRAYQLQVKIEDIRDVWDKVLESIKKSIDYLKGSLGVKKYSYIPYRDIIPLIAYFYFKSGKMSNYQKSKLEEWFWKVSFSERYSATTFTRMGEDRVLFDKIIREEEVIIDYPTNINLGKIKNVRMGRKTALRNALLCILAMNNPRHFRNGTPITLDEDYLSQFNSSEKHHIFPRAFLRKNKISEDNFLINFCFIPSELNKEISDMKPSEYFIKYKRQNDDFEKTLKSHIIPSDKDSGIWTDEYHKFIDQRASLVEKEIKKLIGETQKIEIEIEENPNGVIDKLESKIRSKINSILYEELGEDYWKRAVPSDVCDLVERRIKERLQKQPSEDKGEYEHSIKKLEFCDIMDYHKIIFKNWSLFEDILGSKEQVDKHFKNLKEFRNSIKHNRKLNDLETAEGKISIEWLTRALSKGEIEEAIEKSEHSESEHLNRTTKFSEEAYQKIKDSVLKFGTDIEFSPQKHYIAMKRKGSGRNFSAIKVQKNQIKLWVSLEKNTLDDPKKMARDVSSVGHHGTGHYEIIIKSLDDVEYVLEIIKKSYHQN